MNNHKNKEVVWEEVVNGYEAKEIKMKVNWSNAMRVKKESFGGLGGVVFNSLVLRLLLTLFGVYYIFNIWYLGLFFWCTVFFRGILYKNTQNYI